MPIDCAPLASLLEYPWQKPEIADPDLARALAPLEKFIRKQPLEALQDLFTRTFDLAPAVPPYLGFHLHGESYRRGSLMARLRALCRTHGVDERGELPDHLGVVLALMAAAPDDPELVALLKSDLAPGLEKLLAASAKEERDNPYRALLVTAARAMEERVA